MIELHTFGKAPKYISLAAEVILLPKHLEFNFILNDANFEVENSLVPKNWNIDHSFSEKTRAHELWKKTCFEVFWSAPNSKSYWEFNISGEGRWNLYFFDDYRNPQTPKESFDFQLVELMITKNRLHCQLSLTPDSNLELDTIESALTAIIQTKNNETYYFASAHAGDKPDFHLRNSFKIIRKIN